MGIAAGYADVLELIIRHFEQCQTAAPKVHQGIDPEDE